MKSDRLLYKATALDESAHSSAEQPTNEGSSPSSAGKGTNNNSNRQEKHHMGADLKSFSLMDMNKIDSKEKGYQLSEAQEILLQLLRDAEVPQTDAIGVMLMLKEDEDTMWQMATWIYDNHPNDTEIMQWFGRYLKEEKGFKIE